MFNELKNMRFKETLWVNFLRGAAAGAVWMVIMLIVRPPDMPIGLAFSYPIAMPLALVTIIPICWAFFSLLISMGVPFMGLGHLILALFVIPGDPIMFVIHKVAPNIVPIERYSFITWNPYIFVTEGLTSGIRTTGTTASDTAICPYTGRVLADKDITALGFNWLAKETIFQIHGDWKVSTPKDSSFGWIDVNGDIHKGRPIGKIDPKATLSGEIVAKLVGSNCYVGNEKIGEMVKW
jgi:hypothetical protein